MRDINCPYCNAELDINHDDGYGYSEEKLHTQECGFCGKAFVYTTSISFDYDANKADCLNDGKHQFKPTHTYPKFLTDMQCDTCGEQRIPTAEERIEYGIPTYEEYLAETAASITKDAIK